MALRRRGGRKHFTVSFDADDADRWRQVCIETPEEFRSFRDFVIQMVKRGIATLAANPPKETP